jgi:hypothetical protein
MSGCNDDHHGIAHWLADNPGWAATFLVTAVIIEAFVFGLAITSL